MKTAYEYGKTKPLPYDGPKYVRNQWLQNMFNRYEDYYRAEIAHIIENQRFYWGRNYGQWPAYVVEVLKSQGRTPPTYNITAAKLEKELGSYIANGFDMKWETVSGRNSDWAMWIMDMALSDKRNCGWDISKIIAMRDMKVAIGYERMVISDRFDSTFGNIGYEPLPPTHIYLDPAWKSPYAWDIDNYFEWGMFSPSKIIEMFPRMAEELREWKEREELTGINFGDYNAGIQRWQTTEAKWGDFHRVITYHSLRKYTRKWEYDLVNRCAFPETGFPEGSKEEKEAKQQYIQAAGLGEGDYTVVNQNKREKRIEVICPTLNSEMFFASGKDRIQTNNCNIYPLANMFNGQSRSMVDDLYDINRDFNKEQMNESEIMLTAAKGSYIMDEALAGGDEGKKREIEQRSNIPGAKVWVAEGTTQDLGQHGGIIELPRMSIPNDMFSYSGKKLELADWLTTPAAMDSRSTSSTTSGKLFQSQVQVGLVGQQYPMSIIQLHETEKMMAYALQAKITYSGYPRSFATAHSKGEALEINTPGVDPIGRRVTINDISKMPEMKVTLVKSISGLNVRSELRDQYGSSLQFLKDPKDRLARLVVLEALFDTQDISDEKKEEIARAFKMLKANEALAITLNQKGMMGQLQGAGLQQPGQQETQPQITEAKFDEAGARQGTLQENQVTQDQLQEAV